MDILALLGFLILGVGLGTFGTIIGAGGGFLLVPILLLLGWPHTEAVATSLFMVTANAVSGSISYWRQRRIDLATGWRFALATVPGALIGTTISPLLSGRVFSIIFGILLLVLSVYLFFNPERRRTGSVTVPPRPAGAAGWLWTTRDFTDAHGEHWTYGFSQGWGLLLSFGVGFLSSILGIGGGIIHVPALINLFNFPAHIATATSHFILAISAATGTTAYLAQGAVQLGPGIALAVGAIAGAQVGGAVSRRVRSFWIVRGLSLALALVSLRLLF